MPTTRVEVITPERVVFAGDADMVLAPGAHGQLGILPRHAYLLTALAPGELIIRRAGEEDLYIAVGGGFMEVAPDFVTVLADTAERAVEIDLARAEEARRRAQALLEQKLDRMQLADAEAALRRATTRLKVGRRRRRGTSDRPGTE